VKAAIRNRIVMSWTGRILPVTKLEIVWAKCLLEFLQGVISDVYNGATRRRSYFWLDFRSAAQGMEDAKSKRIVMVAEDLIPALQKLNCVSSCKKTAGLHS
jgi:hypothetical protein